MANFIKNVRTKLVIFFHSLFFGLKGGDEIITESANYGTGTDSNVTQKKVYDDVLADFLDGKETQRVVEMRDEYYRVFKESDKYEVSVNGLFDENGEDLDGEVTVETKRKVKSDFLKRIEVYNPENLKVRTIQDCKMIPIIGNYDAITLITVAEHDQMVPNITVERDGFTPRFELERYANKVVVRTIDDKKCFVDFYTTIYASQFGKIDALFIAELNRIREKNLMRSDTTSFKTIDFVSDKAFNTDDLCEFKYTNPKYKSINIFDGNFVLTFECDVVLDGYDITEKYKTDEVTKNYEEKAPKGKSQDIFAVNRRVENDEKNNEFNFEKTTLKL